LARITVGQCEEPEAVFDVAVVDRRIFAPDTTEIWAFEHATPGG